MDAFISVTSSITNKLTKLCITKSPASSPKKTHENTKCYPIPSQEVYKTSTFTKLHSFTIQGKASFLGGAVFALIPEAEQKILNTINGYYQELEEAKGLENILSVFHHFKVYQESKAPLIENSKEIAKGLFRNASEEIIYLLILKTEPFICHLNNLFAKENYGEAAQLLPHFLEEPFLYLYPELKQSASKLIRHFLQEAELKKAFTAKKSKKQDRAFTLKSNAGQFLFNTILKLPLEQIKDISTLKEQQPSSLLHPQLKSLHQQLVDLEQETEFIKAVAFYNSIKRKLASVYYKEEDTALIAEKAFHAVKLKAEAYLEKLSPFIENKQWPELLEALSPLLKPPFCAFFPEAKILYIHCLWQNGDDVALIREYAQSKAFFFEDLSEKSDWFTPVKNYRRAITLKFHECRSLYQQLITPRQTEHPDRLFDKLSRLLKIFNLLYNSNLSPKANEMLLDQALDKNEIVKTLENISAFIHPLERWFTLWEELVKQTREQKEAFEELQDALSQAYMRAFSRSDFGMPFVSDSFQAYEASSKEVKNASSEYHLLKEKVAKEPLYQIRLSLLDRLDEILKRFEEKGYVADAAILQISHALISKFKERASSRAHNSMLDDKEHSFWIKAFEVKRLMEAISLKKREYS